MGRPTRRGVTLIEVLTVLIIIAVLLSLLLPTLGTARQTARRTQCVANLRQIHSAAVAWQNDKRPAKLRAIGWMETLKPYVVDTQIYSCAGSELVLASLDKAGTYKPTSSNSPTGTVSGDSSTNEPMPKYDDAVVRIDPGNGFIWEVPLAEGPWMQKRNENGNSFELWLEDQGFKGGGDKDFADVIVRVTDHGDGTSTLEVVPQPPGKKSGYKSSIATRSPEGEEKSIFENLYKNGKTGTEKVMLDGSPSDPRGESSGKSTDANGNPRPGFWVEGNGAPADYGMNPDGGELMGRPGKVLALDYTYSVVNVISDNWATPQWLADGSTDEPIFARHIKRVNVLHGDGAVESTYVSPSDLNPGFAGNRAKYWQK